MFIVHDICDMSTICMLTDPDLPVCREATWHTLHRKCYVPWPLSRPCSSPACPTRTRRTCTPLGKAFAHFLSLLNRRKRFIHFRDVINDDKCKWKPSPVTDLQLFPEGRSKRYESSHAVRIFLFMSSDPQSYDWHKEYNNFVLGSP